MQNAILCKTQCCSKLRREAYSIGLHKDVTAMLCKCCECCKCCANRVQQIYSAGTNFSICAIVQLCKGIMDRCAKCSVLQTVLSIEGRLVQWGGDALSLTASLAPCLHSTHHHQQHHHRYLSKSFLAYFNSVTEGI